MDVPSRGLADPVDGVTDRQHMVADGPLKPARLPLGRAEVDDPGSTPSSCSTFTALTREEMSYTSAVIISGGTSSITGPPAASGK